MRKKSSKIFFVIIIILLISGGFVFSSKTDKIIDEISNLIKLRKDLDYRDAEKIVNTEKLINEKVEFLFKNKEFKVQYLEKIFEEYPESNCLTSNDGKIFIFSWASHEGGSFQVYYSFVRLEDDKGGFDVIFLSEGKFFPVLYENIYMIKEKNKDYYFAVGTTKTAGDQYSTVFLLFCIEDKKIKFITPYDKDELKSICNNDIYLKFDIWVTNFDGSEGINYDPSSNEINYSFYGSDLKFYLMDQKDKNFNLKKFLKKGQLLFLNGRFRLNNKP